MYRLGVVVALLATAWLSVSADEVVLNETWSYLPGQYYNGDTLGDAWTVAGEVDIVGSGYYGYLCTDAGWTGQCLDLSGWTPGGVVTTAPLTFYAGVDYTLYFEAAGSQRPQWGPHQQLSGGSGKQRGRPGLLHLGADSEHAGRSDIHDSFYSNGNYASLRAYCLSGFFRRHRGANGPGANHPRAGASQPGSDGDRPGSHGRHVAETTEALNTRRKSGGQERPLPFSSTDGTADGCLRCKHVCWF